MVTETLVSDRLVEALGVWTSSDPSYPIDRSEIRRWAIAVHWPETPPRLYWDEDYARTTRWGGIIAPPDFNPFAWPPCSPPDVPQPYHALPGEAGHHLLNGGQQNWYHAPMRPGDVVVERHRIKDYEEREGRFGLMLYVRIEREIRNQSEQLVRTSIDTVVRY